MKLKKGLVFVLVLILTIWSLPMSTFADDDVRQATVSDVYVDSSSAEKKPENGAVNRTIKKGDKDSASEKKAFPALRDSITVSGVKINIDVQEGVFPEGSKLSAVRTGSEQIGEALSKERDEGVIVAASYAFDIKVTDPDGAEIQPRDGRDVKLVFETDEVKNHNLTTSVYHLKGDKEKGDLLRAEKLEVTEKNNEAQVKTEGFSYYTVEFTYGEKQYVLPGNDKVALDDILAEVGLSGTVTSVSVSDDTLISVENKDGEYTVASLAPFTTEEWMNVVLDGIEYHIVITDEIAVDPQNIYVSVTGSDDSGNGSETDPYATIKKAVEHVDSGGTIYLLSDISQEESIAVSKSLTVKSKDANTPKVIKRTQTFAKSLFELRAGEGDAKLSFEDIILDDDFISAGNMQMAVIQVISSSSGKGTIILGNGATVQNYGGNCGVAIQSNTELVMKSGSLITTNGNTSIRGKSAVMNNGGKFVMEKNAKIDNVTGRGVVGAATGVALLSNFGNNTINGIISNCKCSGGSNDYTIIDIQGGSTIIGPDSDIFNNVTKHGTVYAMQGAVIHIQGKIHDNITDNQNTWSSGIYVSDNLGAATVYIEEGAEIYNNKTFVYYYNWNFLGMSFSIPVESPYVSAVYVNGNSSAVMNGGKIYNNSAPFAVMVNKNGRFIMNGGQITGNVTALNIENYQGETEKGRIIINGGTISENGNDVYITESETGYTDGSFAYLSKEMLESELKVKFIRLDPITVGSTTVQKFFHTVTKTITADSSMNELYVGNSSASGKNAIDAVEEVSKDGANLITTWFAASSGDEFNLTVDGLTKVDGDVFVCMVPVDKGGTALDGYKIYKCEKTTTGNGMTVSVRASGSKNEAGYAMGLFSNPVIPENDYTLHYETYGGTEYEDKRNLAFDATDLAPENNPEREGYVFKGWFMNEELTKEYKNTNSYADIVENDIAVKNATLYAKWQEKKGNIIVNKRLAGNGVSGDENKEFLFTITAEDRNGEPLNGTFGDVVFAEGSARFAIIGESSKTIAALPDGVRYSIKEDDYTADGYSEVLWDDVPENKMLKGDIPNNEVEYTATNTKNYIPVMVDPPVKKVVKGRDDKDSFTYTLTAQSNTAGIAKEDMPMPDGSEKGKKQMTKKGGGEYEFGEFELTLPGTYVYTMVEETGNFAYEYDTSTYIVKYVVRAEGNRLFAERTIEKDGTVVKEIVFTNINIKKPLLTINKTSEVKEAKVGDIIPYIITVKNNGEGDAEGLEILDTMGTDLSYVSDDAGGKVDGQKVEWVLNVPSGETKTINIRCRISDSAAGKVVNNVEIKNIPPELVTEEGDRYEHEIMLFEEEPPSDDEDEETPAEKIVNKIDKKQLDKKQLVKKQLARSQKHSLPDTGDEAYLASLVAMLAAAITVLISIIYRRRISRRRSG